MYLDLNILCIYICYYIIKSRTTKLPFTRWFVILESSLLDISAQHPLSESFSVLAGLCISYPFICTCKSYKTRFHKVLQNKIGCKRNSLTFIKHSFTNDFFLHVCTYLSQPKQNAQSLTPSNISNRDYRTFILFIFNKLDCGQIKHLKCYH